MTHDEYIKLAQKKAIELIDTKQIDFHFTNYLCHVALYVKALVKKDIDINDDDLNTMLTQEINTMIVKFFTNDRDIQLASLFFALTNETFHIEYSLLQNALSDAIDIYAKYGNDNPKRKESVIDAAKKDNTKLFAAVIELMKTEEGDLLFKRVNIRYALKQKESNKLKKELKKNFDHHVVIDLDNEIKEYALCGQLSE